jgi:SNF2 family DNA or RNA helicase
MAGAYVLPNRKAFADYITRIFLKHRDKPTDDDDKDVDLCTKRGNARELLPHQKIVRDYLMAETPYRGLLVYHGLGSGKTCSSIAVAESLLSDRKVFVMLPASLEINYRGELRKCGDPIYAYEQHWEMREVDSTARAEEAKKLGISDGFLDRNAKFFVTIPNQEANFNVLPVTARTLIGKQIEDILDQRFTFVRYNGLSSGNISKYAPTEGPNPYDNSVVIIDEVHEFISRVSNASDLGRRLYDAIYKAKNCKVVALSGTPVVNRATEIAFLMNLLRGPIERISIPIKSIPTWDEEKMKTVLQAIPDVDTIEFNTLKKTIMVTRNPPHFRSVYNEAGERIAVQYHKDVPFTEVAADWVKTFQNKFQLDVGGAEIAMERITTE